jgi:uncharacterized membrane protein
MNYTDQQIDLIVDSMTSGIHGSFARAIGEALMLADSTNQQIILKSFSALFSKVASFLDIEPTQSKSDHELYIERRINVLDKKLMHGHISQEEYDRRVSELP